MRGIATILFGLAAVFWPALTLVTLVYLFSAYVLVSGIVNLVGSIMTIDRSRWWFLGSLIGIFEFGVGVYLVRHPRLSFATLILLVGFTLIARGVIEVVASFFEIGQTATVRALTVIIGLAGLLAGIILLFQPVSAGVAFVWILGLYALIVGTLEIALASDAHRASEAPSRRRQ